MNDTTEHSTKILTRIFQVVVDIRNIIAKKSQTVRATHLESLKSDLTKYFFWVVQSGKHNEVTNFQKQLATSLQEQQLFRLNMHQILEHDHLTSAYYTCLMDLSDAYFQQDNGRLLLSKFSGIRNRAKVSLLLRLKENQHGMTVDQIEQQSTVAIKKKTIYEHLNQFNVLGLVNYDDRLYSLSWKGKSLLELLHKADQLDGLHHENEQTNKIRLPEEQNAALVRKTNEIAELKKQNEKLARQLKELTEQHHKNEPEKYTITVKTHAKEADSMIEGFR